MPAHVCMLQASLHHRQHGRTQPQEAAPAGGGRSCGGEGASRASAATTAAEELITEVDGLQLHLSTQSSTGYKGVYFMGDNPRHGQLRFWAVATGHATRLTGQRLIGRFETKLEAAISYAKWAEAWAAEARATEARVGAVVPIRITRPVLVRVAIGASGAVELCLKVRKPGGGSTRNPLVESKKLQSFNKDAVSDCPSTRLRHPPALNNAVAKEAEGWRLHLSSSSPTGYAGVRGPNEAGRFQAYRPGDRKCLGSFDMALDAAVAYARAVAEAKAASSSGGGASGLVRKRTADAVGLTMTKAEMRAAGYKLTATEKLRAYITACGGSRSLLRGYKLRRSSRYDYEGAQSSWVAPNGAVHYSCSSIARALGLTPLTSAQLFAVRYPIPLRYQSALPSSSGPSQLSKRPSSDGPPRPPDEEEAATSRPPPGTTAKRPRLDAGAAGEGRSGGGEGPSNPGPIAGMGDNVYRVEALLAQRRVEGRRQFLVRWKDYSPAHDSWESEVVDVSLEPCP